MRAKDRRGTFCRRVGSGAAANSSHAPHATALPQSPSPPRAGKPGALQPGPFSKSDAVLPPGPPTLLPAPSTQDWDEEQRSRRDPGSPRGAAASETQEAKV